MAPIESFSYGTNTPALSRNNSFEVPFDEDIPRNTKDAIIYLHQIGIIFKCLRLL